MLFSSVDAKFTLYIKESAIAAILTAIEKSHPLETGGVLIGTYENFNKVAIIDQAILATSDSLHKKSSFYRGVKGLSDMISDLNKQNPKLHYLGEWHTHPSSTAQPSLTDIAQMNIFARKTVFGAPTPILLVIGGAIETQLQWNASVHRAWSKPIYLQLI